MSVTDFFIGLFLMNAMPHFVLGVWKGRILSGFGMGPRANLAYSAVNIAASLGLFVSAYGVQGLAQHGVYAGALAILLVYYATGHYFYRRFHVEHFAGRVSRDGALGSSPP